MTGFRSGGILAVAAALGALVAGCSTSSFFSSSEPPPPAPAATPVILPSSIPARDVVGRWGFAAYHSEADRARIETAARGQCGQPYVISAGPTGGVIMHLAAQAQPQELILKGGPGGKNFIGLGDEGAGG